MPPKIRLRRYQNFFFGAKGHLLHYGVYDSLFEAESELEAHSNPGHYSIDQTE